MKEVSKVMRSGMLGRCHLRWAGREGVRGHESHSEEESCTGRELQLTGSREKERLTFSGVAKRSTGDQGPREVRQECGEAVSR